MMEAESDEPSGKPAGISKERVEAAKAAARLAAEILVTALPDVALKRLVVCRKKEVFEPPGKAWGVP